MGRPYRLAAGALLAAMLLPCPAVAAQFSGVSVVVEHGGYKISLDALIDAPEDRVLGILTDYAHLRRMNPDIIGTTVTRAPSGSGERVRTVLHSCVWLVCRNLVQVEDVTEPDHDTIEARIVPGAGDFASGHSVWRLATDGARTRVHYEAVRGPAAGVPRFIGSSLLKRTLHARLLASIDALERLARSSRRAPPR